MLIPKSLTIQNIGRFVTKQTVNFDNLGNLIQIDAENHNTGGSSGSGKSTIFNAMEYNLGLNDLPVTVLQSRLTSEGIYTEGVYDWDGKEVLLIRGKGKLSISVDGETTEGAAKLVEEKIDTIIGMDRALFRPLLHKRQKEGGFFLSKEMTASKKHEFLTNVLNLGDYAKKIDKVDKQIKELTDLKLSKETELKSTGAALKATQDAILALGLAPVRDMHQSVVLDLKNKADASLAVLGAVQSAHRDQLILLDAQRPKQSEAPSIPSPVLEDAPFDRMNWDLSVGFREVAEKRISEILETERQRQASVNKSIQERKISLSTLNYKITLSNTAKTEVLKLAGEVKKIRECLCPTCEQQWVTEAAKNKEAELLTKITGLRAQITEGESAEQSITAINAEIESLTKDLTPFYDPLLPVLNEEIANRSARILEEKAKFDAHNVEQKVRNDQIMADYKAKLYAAQAQWSQENKAASDEFALKQQALRHSQTIELDQARGQADVDRRAFEAAAQKLRAFEEANARYSSSFGTLKKQEEQYNQKVADIGLVMVNTEKKLVIAEETKRAIKSFMSCSFDEALEEIGDTATRIIRSIPNMANSTIQFQGVRETQSGKVKEEVNAVISMDGEEGVDIRSLSGGERSSADLAIDLAVIDLIENRSNKGVSVFILDEPFTGLDSVSIEMVLEVLKNAKINKKLVIVDHNETVKEMVTDRIVVVRDGLTSKIVQ